MSRKYWTGASSSMPEQLGKPCCFGYKKDGLTRFCMDYHKVNKVTRKDTYPLPQIDDILDSLRGSQYFSTLDLYLEYWQLTMDLKEIKNCVCLTSGAVPFHSDAFRLLQHASNFRMTHGTCALWAQLEDLPHLCR